MVSVIAIKELEKIVNASIVEIITKVKSVLRRKIATGSTSTPIYVIQTK